MYETFFNLEDSPFGLTPDPRFLFRSKGHHGVLSTLVYGITSQKGVMALIGDVGTGKTTLCWALMRELPEHVQSALVLNPHLSDSELLAAILHDLGVEHGGATKGELMAALHNFLLGAGREGKTVVVIVDEAQRMSVRALEQIRILSNLETPKRKLLQIVLVGQPELEEKLKRRELRQVDQRIGIRCSLRPLSKRETFRYIEHRLRVVGLVGTLPFRPGALSRIYRYSRGIPRVINQLSDRVLAVGYSFRAREITAAMVKTAIEHLEGTRKRRRARALRPALAACLVGALLLSGMAAIFWRGRLAVGAAAPVTARAALPSPRDVPGDGSAARLLARSDLGATFLPQTTLAELRAMALPAVLELNEPSGPRSYLLQRITDDAIFLVTPSGQEVTHTPNGLEPLWTHSAWVFGHKAESR